MQMSQIRKVIANAVADEKRSGRLANVFRDLAKARGRRLRAKEVNNAVAFIQEYIEHVPTLLEATVTAASQAGVIEELMPMLEVAEQYVLNPHDMFPDHLGLLGLMDDAYYVLNLIQTVSDRYQQMTGRPLLPADLTPANQAIRILIGEPWASQLDMGIMAALALPAIQLGLGQLSALGAALQYRQPDPIWGNASIDEIVNARLGAMGVV